MIHQPSGGAQGQASDIKIVADKIIDTTLAVPSLFLRCFPEYLSADHHPLKYRREIHKPEQPEVVGVGELPRRGR